MFVWTSCCCVCGPFEWAPFSAVCLHVFFSYMLIDGNYLCTQTAIPTTRTGQHDVMPCYVMHHECEAHIHSYTQHICGKCVCVCVGFPVFVQTSKGPDQLRTVRSTSRDRTQLHRRRRKESLPRPSLKPEREPAVTVHRGGSTVPQDDRRTPRRRNRPSR